jgi:hypothetical protein
MTATTQQHLQHQTPQRNTSEYSQHPRSNDGNGNDSVNGRGKINGDASDSNKVFAHHTASQPASINLLRDIRNKL